MGLAHQALVLKSGNRVREFNKGRVIVGRAKDADFRIDDPNVSRRHAAIYWENGRVMVEDLDSTNGTLVNGYPVLNTPLNRSDIVYIGGHKITVETR
jgi:pSer/pThr/pTyr-binding forkhead associated (FHA) protein